MRGLGFGFGFTVGLAVEVDEEDEVDGVAGFALLFVVALADGFAVVFAVVLDVAFTVGVGVGVGFFVAADAELPDTAIASTRKSESLLNRAPT